MEINPGEIRARLAELDWGEGLTREEIARQAPDLADTILDQLPPSYRFSDAGSILSYFRHVVRAGVVPTEVRDIVGEADPPRGFGDAPTGQTIVLPDDEHGVGSGAGSGYTGSSAQTGEDREGVPYTDSSDSQAPTVSGDVILPSDVDDDDQTDDAYDEQRKPGPVRRYRIEPEKRPEDEAA